MLNQLINFLKIDLSGKRIFGLDLLRFLAIFLVMIGHSQEHLPNKIQNIIKLFLVDGVAIFFVLSGFLIGGIIIKSFEKETTWKSITNFWTRRWLRTLPNYYLILFSLFIINLITGKNTDYLEFIKYPFFLQNLYFPIGDFFPESWSLAIEEWFYTIIPLLILGISFITPKSVSFKKRLFIVILSVIIAVLAYRIFKYFHLAEKSYYMYDRFFLRQVLARLDAIMFGVLGAWLHHYYPALFYKSKKIFFGIGVALLLLTHNFESKSDLFLYILAFSSTSIGVLMMLPLMNAWKNTQSFLRKPIIYGSLISYSLYLVNLSLVSVHILPLFSVAPWAKFLLFWGINILLSTLLYKYFEVPIMNWRDRITKKH